jgi:hypothetical protein
MDDHVPRGAGETVVETLDAGGTVIGVTRYMRCELTLRTHIGLCKQLLRR